MENAKRYRVSVYVDAPNGMSKEEIVRAAERSAQERGVFTDTKLSNVAIGSWVDGPYEDDAD